MAWRPTNGCPQRARGPQVAPPPQPVPQPSARTQRAATPLGSVQRVLQATRRAVDAHRRPPPPPPGAFPTLPCAPACRPDLQGPRAAAQIIILEPTVPRGGWDEQQQLSVQSPPRPTALQLAAPPRSPLPAAIPEQSAVGEGGGAGAGGMSQIVEGSLSGSSHGSLGELGSPPEAQLSELEQRKVVVLG